LSQVVLSGRNTLFVGKLPAELASKTYGEMTRALDLREQGGLVIGVTNSKTGADFVNPSDTFALGENMKVLYLAPQRILETE
jgi:hypothetical protein